MLAISPDIIYRFLGAMISSSPAFIWPERALLPRIRGHRVRWSLHDFSRPYFPSRPGGDAFHIFIVKRFRHGDFAIDIIYVGLVKMVGLFRLYDGRIDFGHFHEYVSIILIFDGACKRRNYRARLRTRRLFIFRPAAFLLLRYMGK